MVELTSIQSLNGYVSMSIQLAHPNKIPKNVLKELSGHYIVKEDDIC